MAQSEKIIISVELKDKGVQSGLKGTTSSINKAANATENLANAEKDEAYWASEAGKAEALRGVKTNIAKGEAKALAQETIKLTKATKEGKTQTGLNSAILTEAGRAASDFQYGMQGMANNIGQLTTLVGQHVQTQGGFIASMSELGKSLFGMGGILIGLQLFISYLPAIEDWYRKVTNAGINFFKVFKDAGQTVASSAADFEIYLGVLQDTSRSQEEHNTAVEGLKRDFPEYISLLDEASISLQDVKRDTDAAKDAEILYRKELVKTARTNAAKSAIEKQQSLLVQKTIETEEELRLLGFESLDEAREAMAKKDVMLNGLRTNSIEEYLARIEEEGDMHYFYEKQRAEAYTPQDKRLKALLHGLDSEIGLRERNTQALMDFINLGDTPDPKPIVTPLDVKMIGDGAVAIGELEVQALNLNKTVEKSTFTKLIDFQEKMMAFQEKAVAVGELASGFIDSEITREEAKTTKLNNELRDRMRNENLSADERKNIQAKIAKNDLILAKKKDKLAEKQFKIDKALRISAALIDTYAATLKAYGSQLVVGDPTSIIRAKIVGGITAAFGLAKVAAIARTKFVPSATSAPPIGGAGGGTGGGSAAPQAPAFNIVGSSGVNQLSDAIAGQEDRPVRTYVVASDVSTAQELDRNIIESASL